MQGKARLNRLEQRLRVPPRPYEERVRMAEGAADDVLVVLEPIDASEPELKPSQIARLRNMYRDVMDLDHTEDGTRATAPRSFDQNANPFGRKPANSVLPLPSLEVRRAQ